MRALVISGSPPGAPAWSNFLEWGIPMPTPCPQLWSVSFCRKTETFGHQMLSSTAWVHKSEGLEVKILPGDTAQLLCETTSKTDTSKVCSTRKKVKAVIWECFPGGQKEVLGNQIHFGPLKSPQHTHKVENHRFRCLCQGPLFERLQLRHHQKSAAYA